MDACGSDPGAKEAADEAMCCLLYTSNPVAPGGIAREAGWLPADEISNFEFVCSMALAAVTASAVPLNELVTTS